MTQSWSYQCAAFALRWPIRPAIAQADCRPCRRALDGADWAAVFERNWPDRRALPDWPSIAAHAAARRAAARALPLVSPAAARPKIPDSLQQTHKDTDIVMMMTQSSVMAIPSLNVVLLAMPLLLLLAAAGVAAASPAVLRCCCNRSSRRCSATTSCRMFSGSAARNDGSTPLSSSVTCAALADWSAELSASSEPLRV